jgi:predicted Rossmann fold nucleotide-binding protein DprA/Smf involved in DNA uptake
MRVGIVGSRRRLDKENVISFVQTLSPNDIVVSGGCRGPDTFAEEEAKRRGMQVIIFLPDQNRLDTDDSFEIIEAYYARNKQIAENCDELHAFVGYFEEWNNKIQMRFPNEEV